MPEKCRTCKFIDPINDKKGKCKVSHPQRCAASNSLINSVRISDGWPIVELDGNACGEYKGKL